MPENITDSFINEMINMAQREIPQGVVEQVKLSVIDYMACTYLGESTLRIKNQEYLKNVSSDVGNSVIVGAGRKTSVHVAAMVNGINAHVAELDDGHRYAMMHLAAPIISALLAIKGNHPITGEQFIKGICVGYEAAIRLASAVQPGHKLKGYHATGTCGTIGASVGIAVALGYSFQQMKNAVSAAATDAAGILEVIDDASELKPYNIGRAAVAAINAVYVGGSGFSGPDDILGGKRGFFKVMAQDVNLSYLKDGFGDKYAIELIYRKPYAACRHCHAAIEAVMDIAKKNRLKPEQIKNIQINTYGLAVGGHDHTDVRGASSAKMSTPYSTAVALVYGKADYQQFEDNYLKDSKVRAVMNKVSVSESAELSALVPEKRGAIAIIETDCGTFEKRVDYPKGEPENPISAEELENKYYSLTQAAGVDTVRAKQVLNKIWNLETEFNEFVEII